MKITAAEFFEQQYGHSYNAAYSSIEMIKFAEDYAQLYSKERYEKALSYYENVTSGETKNAVKQALLIASGYLFKSRSRNSNKLK